VIPGGNKVRFLYPYWKRFIICEVVGSITYNYENQAAEL